MYAFRGLDTGQQGDNIRVHLPAHRSHPRSLPVIKSAAHLHRQPRGACRSTPCICRPYGPRQRWCSCATKFHRYTGACNQPLGSRNSFNGSIEAAVPSVSSGAWRATVKLGVVEVETLVEIGCGFLSLLRRACMVPQPSRCRLSLPAHRMSGHRPHRSKRRSTWVCPRSPAQLVRERNPRALTPRQPHS